jgi:hypothetical protein
MFPRCWHISQGCKKSRETGCRGGYFFYGGALYFWVVSTELASCHFSGAKKFDMAPRLLADVCTPDMSTEIRDVALRETTA